MFYFDEVHGRMRLDNADASLCLRRPSLRMREDHLSNDSCTAANWTQNAEHCEEESEQEMDKKKDWYVTDEVN